VPHWYKASHTIAYWDKFGRPQTKPRFDRGILDTWWFEDAKAATVKTAATGAPEPKPVDTITVPAPEIAAGDAPAAAGSAAKEAPESAAQVAEGKPHVRRSIVFAIALLGLVVVVILFVRARRAARKK
jgi:microcin C transport system substrate-binding protein